MCYFKSVCRTRGCEAETDAEVWWAEEGWGVVEISEAEHVLDATSHHVGEQVLDRRATDQWKVRRLDVMDAVECYEVRDSNCSILLRGTNGRRTLTWTLCVSLAVSVHMPGLLEVARPACHLQ